jgi:DNA-directed RNA polymerase specialized sigma24 family protein
MASEDEEFTMLFQDFYPSLCRFLECLLGGRAPLAQDLAQESFLQLHRTAWGTLPVGEARFWLYRVARNMAINEFRKSHTRYRLFDRVVEVNETTSTQSGAGIRNAGAKTAGAGDAADAAGRPTHRVAAERAGTVELPRDWGSAEHLGEQGEGRHLSRARVVAGTLEARQGAKIGSEGLGS